MPNATHPKCGKQFPANNTHGHCAGCCRTFVGIASYDAHRTGPADNRTCEIQPYATYRDDGTTRYGHWRDENGYWRYGKRLTQAEKDRIFGDRKDTTHGNV